MILVLAECRKLILNFCGLAQMTKSLRDQKKMFWKLWLAVTIALSAYFFSLTFDKEVFICTCEDPFVTFSHTIYGQSVVRSFLANVNVVNCVDQSFKVTLLKAVYSPDRTLSFVGKSAEFKTEADALEHARKKCPTNTTVLTTRWNAADRHDKTVRPYWKWFDFTQTPWQDQLMVAGLCIVGAALCTSLAVVALVGCALGCFVGISFLYTMIEFAKKIPELCSFFWRIFVIREPWKLF